MWYSNLGEVYSGGRSARRKSFPRCLKSGKKFRARQDSFVTFVSSMFAKLEPLKERRSYHIDFLSRSYVGIFLLPS